MAPFEKRLSPWKSRKLDCDLRIRRPLDHNSFSLSLNLRTLFLCLPQKQNRKAPATAGLSRGAAAVKAAAVAAAASSQGAAAPLGPSSAAANSPRAPPPRPPSASAGGPENSEADAGTAEAASSKPAPPKKKKAIEDIYKKKTQLEHILLRPDTYVGSTERQQV